MQKNQFNPTYENVLQKINGFITVQNRDRHPYTQDFTTILLALVNEMKKIDPLFDILYNGQNLAGSYADNLKVSKPDEFDLVMRMKFRESRHVKIEKNKKKPGFVKLNMTEVLKIIKNQKQNELIYTRLTKLVDNENYLLQDKFQSWIESIITQVLNKNEYNLKFNGKTYNVRYKKTGPAHTMYVDQNGRQLSIDFVPGIVFDKSKWPVERQPPKYAETDWIAVPKPQKNNGDGKNIYFQTSFVDTERFYIQKKQNFKNVLRMIKKLRDRHNVNNLKSYFIKTVFLWESLNLTDDFWRKPAGEILLFMLEKILEYIKNGNMPFFWQKNENMFSNLSKSQLETMYGQMKRVYDRIKRYSAEDPKQIYDVFLTPAELQSLNTSFNIAKNEIKSSNTFDNGIESTLEMVNKTQTNKQGGCIIS